MPVRYQHIVAIDIETKVHNFAVRAYQLYIKHYEERPIPADEFEKLPSTKRQVWFHLTEQLFNGCVIKNDKIAYVKDMKYTKDDIADVYEDEGYIRWEFTDDFSYEIPMDCCLC